jgi:TetR/AcrR family transcriptional regulator, tetracycline repressor protein
VARTTNQVTKGKRRYAAADSGLSRDHIVRAALAQIDEEGLEAFSLRTLATRLNVFPTAIRWYVPNRNELMAQLVNLILEGVSPLRRRRSWQMHLRDIFANFRAAIRAHPNAAPLIGTQLVSNSTMSLGLVENILDTLTRAGLSGRPLVGAYNSVIASLAGFVAQEFAPVPTEHAAAWQISVQERLLGIDRNEFPVLAMYLPLLVNHAFILRWQNGIDAPLDDSFAIFVDVVIAGIEALAAVK